MSPVAGWALAAAALAAGYGGWGWRGLLLAASVVVFWLLLQLSRSLRVLQRAAAAPVGHVASAVVLHRRLRRGMTLVQVLALTRSLGRRLGETPETWAWADDGGAGVQLVLRDGRLERWTLRREARNGAAHDPRGASAPAPPP